MTFSSNRPKFLPNTASLFEELVEQAQFPSTDSKTKKIARWKDWVLPRLYRCLHGVGRPSKPGAASIDDGITPLGDLSRPEEDTDWVYVTLLDIEPSYEEDMELGELHQRVYYDISHDQTALSQHRLANLDQAAPIRSSAPLDGDEASCSANCPTRRVSILRDESDRSIPKHSNESIPRCSGQHAGPIHQRSTSTVPDTPETLHSTIPASPKFNAEVNERVHWKPKLAFGSTSSSLRRSTFSLDKYICQDSHPRGTSLREKSVVRRMSMNDAWLSYARGEDEFSSPTHCDTSLYHSEFQSGLNSDEGRPRSCPTTMTSLSVEAIETYLHPTRNLAFHLRDYSSLKPHMKPLDILHGEEDQQDRMSVLSSLSTISSIGVDIPYPDDYWTWSPEKKNYFHVRQKPDGTEETQWYPTRFA